MTSLPASRAHNPLAMSETAASTLSTALAEVDRAVAAVAAKKLEFARLSVGDKIALLEACVPTVKASVPAWITAACKAKGIREDSPVAGEEWLGGPMLVMRNLRLLIESLQAIQDAG